MAKHRKKSSAQHKKKTLKIPKSTKKKNLHLFSTYRHQFSVEKKKKKQKEIE
jgi:hypothetical protein